VFPVSDKSQDVLNALRAELKELGVKVEYNTKVKGVEVKENRVIGVNANGFIKADKVILATGGKSYNATGSTGDGYRIAKELGHTVTELKASLVPLEVFEINMCKNLQGLSLKNVAITIAENTGKVIYTDFGEMLFTHFGVSGPIILSSSAILLRYKNIDELLKNKSINLSIDLKPALTEEQLYARITRDFEEIKNKRFKNSLDKLLPQKLIETIISLSKINPEKQVNEITKEEKNGIVKLLKNFSLTLSCFRPIDEAIITAGGITIKEINPKTMESKLVSGLCFAGEIIDVDAYTGGFNLQIAYSTGFAAGKSE
jgi:predicted Rossmann fold flavoprotein